MQGGYPDGMTQRDHDEAFKDCPDDRGINNETCQECQRFNDCAREWPCEAGCKCPECEADRDDWLYEQMKDERMFKEGL